MFRKKEKPDKASDQEEAKPQEADQPAEQTPSEGAPEPQPAAVSEASAEPAAAAAAAAEPSPAPAQQPQRVEFDESELVTCYANFCRVTGTPEEVILDFGLNPQPIGGRTESVKVSQRLVVNYYTAKRMLAALHVTVSRHEQTFGPIETNVQKRAQRPGAGG